MKNKLKQICILLCAFCVCAFGVTVFSRAVFAAERYNAETWGEYSAGYVYTYADFSPFAEPDRGTMDNPYEIRTPSQLAALAALVNAYNGDSTVTLTDLYGNTATATNFYKNSESQHIKLTEDIDLSDYGWIPIGTGENNAFKGCFDGGGYTISGLSVESEGMNYAGLFGYVNQATIKNVGISGEFNVNPSSGNAYVGGLVGCVKGSVTIENCYNACAISGIGVTAYAGGLVGNTLSYANVTITNSYNKGNVSATSTAGGLVGNASSNANVTITNSYNIGNVSATSTAGGIVGGVASGTITNCYSACDVSGETSGSLIGIVSSEVTITHCYWYAGGSQNDIGSGTTNGSSIALMQDQMKALAGESDSSWEMIDFLGNTGSLVDVLNKYVTNEANSTDVTLAPWHIHGGEYPTIGEQNETITPDSDGQTHTVYCTGCKSSVKETHRGGTATCTTQAVCEACGASYGEVGGHTPDAAGYTINADGTHSYTCSSCGNPIPEAHTFTDSACTSCGVIGGYCGEEDNEQNVIWTFAGGTLTVSGTGAMADQFNNDNRPWEAYVDQITTIVVNDGITSIGEAAFWNLQQLTTVNLPDSLTTISRIAFGGCRALKTVNLPANLKTIEGWAFQGCYALESVTLPEGLTTVDMYAFSECINLTSVSVPASVTTIGELAFGLSPARITVAEDNLNYSSDEHGVLFDKGKTTLMYCRPNIEVETYTIPSTVTKICQSAFFECKNLVTIIIPEGVTTIGESAFSECTALTAITILAGVTTIEFNTFSGCTSLTTVTIPASVTTIGQWAFGRCTALTTVTIPASVTSIHEDAFDNCNALATVNVPCTWDGSLYTFDESVTVNKVHNWVGGACTLCGVTCDHKDSTHTTATNNGDGTHSFECSVCVNTVIEDHSTTADGDKAANCGSKAYCSECDSEYGDVDKTNHDETVKCENGFCPNCDAYEPATDSNSDGVYEISNAGQLFWFANHVNTMDRTASAVLVADIDLENRPWTPIGVMGEESNNFRGVFDGKNYTIRGLYVEGGRAGLGFFGEVRTGTVKNFTIYGEVVVDTEVDYVGGVIGSICGVNGETNLERNGAIIQNITSYVNLTAKAHGVGMIGGFVGHADHQSLIENCSWYGTFDTGIYRVDSGAGGFIGKIQENTGEVTIRNCAAYGTIKTNYAGDYNDITTIYIGGFLGLSDTGAKTVLESCLFAGKFERGENLIDDAFLGAFGTLRRVNSIKNCYYLGDGVLEAVHSDSDLKPGSDNVEITSVSKAQLLSGEVAYRLGEHFGQILEGENRQSYPVLGGTKVQDSQRFEIYGQQLNIGGDLSMKYYVMGYAPEFNSGALYMEFRYNGVKTKLYAGEPNADGFYVFVLEGINPQSMGDSIRAILYYNETEVTSHGCEDGKEYSVEKNLLNLLEKYKDDAALVALIKDTLAYGETASAYKNHQTMTGNTYTENSSNREIPVSELSASPEGDLRVHQATVRFGTMNHIVLMIESKNGTPTVKVGEQSFDVTLYEENSNYYVSVLHGVSATDFDKDITITISDGTTTVDYTVSINDYLYAISQSTDTSENMVKMKALAKALYNYGVSAKVYHHVVNAVGEHTTVNGICTMCNENIGYDYDETAKTYSVYEAEVLQSVLDEAALCNDTVKLMSDITMDADSYYSLCIGSGTVVLDLNGHSLISADEVAILVEEGATLTVKDSSDAEIPGTIDALSVGIKTTGIKNAGNLFVEGGTIRANTFGILNDGILTISAGDVGSKTHVAIMGGEVILTGAPHLFGGSEYPNGQHVGCDIACSNILVQADLGEEYYSYYDCEVSNGTQNFAEFTGYGLSSDRTSFEKVN